MDWGSVAGLVLAIAAVVVGQLLEGGHLASLFQPAAMIIVMLGTLGAVLLQTRPSNFIRGIKMLWLVFVPPADNRENLLGTINQWSMTARREGLLALEMSLEHTSDAFTAKGLRLIVDGVEPGKLREILDIDIGSYETQERQAAKIWEAAGGYSPTIGIIGAVLGLIHVMENLSDPSKLGGGIAVAFVATIYGVGLANLIFLPISNKLKVVIGRELAQREMLADAFLCIANGDNPRIIEERMTGHLI